MIELIGSILCALLVIGVPSLFRKLKSIDETLDLLCVEIDDLRGGRLGLREEYEDRREDM